MKPSTDAVCRICYQPFIRFRTTQVICSPRCAQRMAKIAEETRKDERKADRQKLDKIRPLSYWMGKAQHAFNAYIRERDKALPCIACGRYDVTAWHASHYLSTGARPELRFHEANVWAGCDRCNLFLHGNLVNYRIGLIDRIGLAAVEVLEGPHELPKWTSEDLMGITREYKAKLKALKA